MFDLAIFAALGWERRAVTDALQDVVPVGPRTWRGRLGDGASCLVTQTGIGLLRAWRAAAATPPARRFLVCGCAGGLVATLRAGDLVAATGVIPLDGKGRPGARLPAEHDALRAWAIGTGFRVWQGDVVSSPVILRTAAAKQVAAAGGALVVEMESAGVADVARSRDIPFVGLRVVLDGVDEEVRIPAGLVDEETGELRPVAATRLVLQPWRWPTMARLARRSRVAEASLRAVLAALAGTGLAALDPAPARTGTR